MVAIAGVAVEGLTPPTEKRHWPKPHHFSKVLTVSHNDSTAVVSRAIMMSMELIIANRAPHDVIFLDGSLTTPFIYFNQAWYCKKPIQPSPFQKESGNNYKKRRSEHE